jgi:hypothetical protein
MNSGIVSLEPLHEFVRLHPGPEALDGNSKIGRKYGQLAFDVTRSIETSPGVYLWGAYDQGGFWKNIYVGKAPSGKTPSGKTAKLKARILEELKDERCCLWHAVLTETQLMDARARYYGSRYEYEWLRSFRKAGATHIAWVSYPEVSNHAVQNIESDLIELLNPSGNLERRVTPPTVQQHTLAVVGHLRSQVHSERKRRYRIA